MTDLDAILLKDAEIRKRQQEQAQQEKQKRYQHKEKRSFIVYHDWHTYLDLLADDRKIGRLFRALFEYAINKEIVDLNDDASNMALAFMIRQFERDAEKYDATCKQNAENRAKAEEYKKQREAQRPPSTTVNENDR